MESRKPTLRPLWLSTVPNPHTRAVLRNNSGFSGSIYLVHSGLGGSRGLEVCVGVPIPYRDLPGLRLPCTCAHAASCLGGCTRTEKRRC